jgi:iron complex outermembrane receptor protein
MKRSRSTPLALSWTLGAAGLMSVFGAMASAQAPEPLVWSASRYAQSTYQAPASVTVITRDEIVRFGYRTLADVLSTAGGMSTTYDRNYTYLTVRGLAKLGDFNTRVLLMIDGRRINQPTDDSGPIGTEGLVDLDAVERVEIIRGPGSTLYGTNAFYAVVNVVTRTGASVAGLEVHAYGGSFESAFGSLVGGAHRADGLDVFGSFSGFSTRGPDLYFREFDTEATAGGHAVGLDGDRTGKALLRVTKGDFSAEALYSSRRKEIPTASYDTVFGDPRARTNDGGGMVSAAFEHSFEDLSRLWVNASFNAGFYEGNYPYQPEVGLFSDYVRSRWLTLESQYQRFVGSHRLSVGGEARRNVRLDQGGSGVYADSRSSSVLAAFVQGEFRLGRRVLLHAGARYDHYDTFGGTLNPRIAVVAEPWTGTFLKGSYGRAFRAPSAYELHYEDGGLTQKPALVLDPERLETFEAALERRLRPGLKASLAVYHTRVRDVIGLTRDPQDGLLVFANGTEAHTSGLEMRLEGLLGPRLRARASYAFQHAEEGVEGARPAGSPRHVGYLGVSAAWIDDQLVSSLELRYVGERPALEDVNIAAYARFDVTLLVRPRFAPRWELQCKVTNLLDTNYADPGGNEHRQRALWQDGRTAWAGLRLRF